MLRWLFEKLIWYKSCDHNWEHLDDVTIVKKEFEHPINYKKFYRCTKCCQFRKVTYD